MDYVRQIDFEALRTAARQGRGEQTLLDRNADIAGCHVRCMEVPPGQGSPAGRHKHTFDKFFYIISGTMDLEIDGASYQAGPGAIVTVPEGVPHRNWNGGTEPVVHLAVFIPGPNPGEPTAIPVEG